MRIHDDQPIHLATDDLLDRNVIAEQLASIIKSRAGKPCFTVGVVGEWGIGKTSILNLSKRHLHQTTAPIHWNPWAFGSASAAIVHLLTQFARVAAEHGLSPARNSRLQKRMRQYSAALEPAATLAAYAAGLSLPGIPKLISTTLTTVLDKSETGLDELKADISGAISELGLPVPVFVDDIDRLPLDELEACFRTMRMCADFDSVVYILAFDKRAVTQTLEARYPAPLAQDYIDKFIQLELHVPSPDAIQLDRFARHEIGRITGNPTAADAVLGKDPSELPPSFRKPPLCPEITSSLRSTKRFLNSLSATYALVAGSVNTSDYLLLHYLRCFHPDTYTTLARNRTILTGLERTVLPARKTSEQFNAVVSAIGSGSRDQGRLYAVFRLFPALSGSYGGTGGPSADRDELELRVCDPNTVERYFSLTPGNDTHEIALARKLVGSIGPSDTAATAAEKLTIAFRQSRDLPLLLRRLRLEAQNVGGHEPPILVSAILLAFSGELAPIEPENALAMCFIIEELLDRITPTSKAVKISEEVIRQTPLTYLAATLFRRLQTTGRGNIRAHHFPASLIGQAMKEHWAALGDSGRIAVLRRYPKEWQEVLQSLRFAGGSDFLSEFIANTLCATSEDATPLLNALVAPSPTGAAKINCALLGSFVDLISMSNRLLQLRPSNANAISILKATRIVTTVYDYFGEATKYLRAVSTLKDSQTIQAPATPPAWSSHDKFWREWFGAHHDVVCNAIKWIEDHARHFAAPVVAKNITEEGGSRRILLPQAEECLEKFVRTQELIHEFQNRAPSLEVDAFEARSSGPDTGSNRDDFL